MRNEPTITDSSARPEGASVGSGGEALVGQSIRHFVVERELGRGGMGIVYLAHDTRLEREVALKVLHAEVAADPALLARFRREAKLLAAMNHPNIATIYGLEEIADGRQAIVMEFLDGETLAERLRREPLSPNQALEILEQVAEALEQAHGRGVIHRDLKPRNLLLGQGGVVKVLDFGLARRAGDSDGPPSPSDHPSSDSAISARRESLPFAGTPGYMSPEQNRGEPDDHRTDVFAFGCILYECVTGRPAFDGSLPAEQVAIDLAHGPDWSRWPAEMSAPVRVLAGHCLEPDRERRLADLGEAQDVLRAARGLATAPPPAADIPGLPRHATSFIGRSSEIAGVEQLLRRSRLLTLTGPGGCGKTRLAREIALRTAASYPDGAAFVDLSPIPDGQRVPLEVGFTLGLREQKGKPVMEMLVERLREKKILIVIDNCEQVLTSCASLAARLLQSCPEVGILATSREALGVAGEQEFSVPPLQLSEENSPHPENVLASEAVQLFVARARLVQPEFELTEGNGTVVAEICRRVDAIPLGIELAAARVRVLSPAQILEQLQGGQRVLQPGEASSSARHRTVEATIQWSYDQLAEPQQKTLRALSLFASGWTLDAAEAIGGDSGDSFATLDDLTQLVNKSLIGVERRLTGDFRYRMLETIRQFSREALRAAGEEAATRARYVDYFLAWVTEAEPKLIGPEQITWLSRLDADRENLLAAARFCEAVPNGAEKALRLLAGLDRFWIRRGHFGLGQTALDQAFAIPGAEADTIHRAKALCTAASIACIRGEPRSVPLFQEVVALCRSLGDKHVASRALNGLGVCAIDEGDLPLATEYLEEGLALSRATGNYWVTASTIGNLGVILFLRKEYDRARTLFEEGIEKYGYLQDVGGQVTFLGGVSRSSLFLGDIAAARGALLRTAPLIVQLGDKRNAATTLLTAGLLAVHVGEHRTGARLFAAGEVVRASIAAQSQLAPSDKEMQETAVAAIREALGQSGLDEAWSEGRDLEFQESMRAVLEFAHGIVVNETLNLREFPPPSGAR